MSISASVLNKSIRPRSRSLTRGCVMRRILATSACLRPRDIISFWTLIIRSARTSRCSASWPGKPRSRNTLPLDRVTLSLILNLPFRGILSPSLQDQGTKPTSSEFKFTFRFFPGSLFETVEHVNTLCKFSHIEDSMFEPSVDANLLNASSHCRHRLPVIWFTPLLDTSQLEAGDAPCLRRESLEIVAGRSEPKQRLIRHGSPYKY
jgi:hypothetical protein